MSTPPREAWVQKAQAGIAATKYPKFTPAAEKKEFDHWCKHVARGPFSEDPWSEFQSWKTLQVEVIAYLTSPLCKWPTAWEVINDEHG